MALRLTICAQCTRRVSLACGLLPSSLAVRSDGGHAAHGDRLGAGADVQGRNPDGAIYATVTEAGGRLVTGLGRDAFEVYDNGKRQELTVFANDVQRITIIMMLDRSGSMRRNFSLVEEAAEALVEQFLPTDQRGSSASPDAFKWIPGSSRPIGRHSSTSCERSCRPRARRLSGTPSTSASRACCARKAGGSFSCSPTARTAR